VPADDAPVDLSDVARARPVLLLVRDVPREANEMLGTRAGLGEDLDHVAQRLLHLRDEIVADDLLARVPADLSRDEDLTSLGRHAIRVPLGGCPVLRMKKLHGWLASVRSATSA